MGDSVPSTLGEEEMEGLVRGVALGSWAVSVGTGEGVGVLPLPSREAVGA